MTLLVPQMRVLMRVLPVPALWKPLPGVHVEGRPQIDLPVSAWLLEAVPVEVGYQRVVEQPVTPARGTWE